MDRVDHYLTSLAQALARTPREPLWAIEQALWETYERDGTIIVCGNGGSAATASHFACDLAKWTVAAGRRRLRALALTDNVPVMTAWSNDTAYERVFVEQLMTLYRPGDVLVAISGSGNSPNVLRAVEWANGQGAPTVGLTGFDGGKLAGLVRFPLVAASTFMPEVEDMHSAICHGLAVSLGERIKG
ncbi:MAG TPA: SIS domain-containing protein [Roseiflexaceae bacterium]|nr:SIS domain-containing protein [Roseiflexaceae bacterium]